MKKTNETKTKNHTTKQHTPSAPPQAVPVTAAGAAVATGGLASRSQPLTAAEFLAEHRRQQEGRCRQTNADPQTEALVDLILKPLTPAAGLAPSAPAAKAKPHQVIKLGMDVHLDRYVVVRQIEGGAPQPAQRFTPEQFLAWVKKQTELAHQVYSCYEAGPFGYSLHRQLTALGATNYVVRPRQWDEYGQKVKTDKRDAKALVLHLDRYVSGNDKAFCVVRVPSEAEEQARSRSRQRESLAQEKQRLAAQGRSHALYYGGRRAGDWWHEGLWQELTLPAIVRELLVPLRRLIQALELELKTQTQTLQAAAPAELPMGLGQLTYEILEREVCDWKRFANRRQVASYTGMCPREDTSDQRRFQGSINKHGNPRVRTVLVEAAWRLMRWQPEYKPVAKWSPLLTQPKTTKSKRKQIAVAIGRQFSVDWWRVRTGRCQAADLGLKLNPAPATVAPTPRAKTTGAQTAQVQPH
jgi:transposase